MDIISTTLFEAQGVSIFRIPPGEVSLSKWNLKDSNTIWKGDMRLIEEELVQEDIDVFSQNANAEVGSSTTMDKKQSKVAEADLALIKPYKGLRLKMELFNVSNSLVVPPNDSRMEELAIWAEVWYNPLGDESDDQKTNQYSIANNGQETIQMTPQSARYYKIIVQLPGTGYHPFLHEDEQTSQQDNLVQVALGLKISENFAAISFSESLSIYKRRFQNFVEQYQYELRLSEAQNKQKHLSLDMKSNVNEGEPATSKNSEHNHRDNDSDDDDDDDEDDDFGDFVGG